MTDERWLAAVWPFVRGWLPAAPARVLEIGCGPAGGFVPRLLRAGYEVTGIDPEAPPGRCYRQAEFEHCDIPGQVDAIVACTSLHHMADLAEVLDLIQARLVPGCLAVVVEWARERFDRQPLAGASAGCPSLAMIQAGCTGGTPSGGNPGCRGTPACGPGCKLRASTLESIS